jgi:hypothetical protein
MVFLYFYKFMTAVLRVAAYLINVEIQWQNVDLGAIE